MSCVVFVALMLGLPRAAVADEEFPLIDQSLQRFRRPVAMCWIEPGKLLAVANRRGKSVSLVNVSERRMEREFALPAEVLDVDLLQQPSPQAPAELVLLLRNSEILLTSSNSERMFQHHRTKFSGVPAELTVANSGGEVAVSSVWGRRIELFSVSRNLTNGNDKFLEKRSEAQLTFEPRIIRFTPDSELLIAVDAFRGRLAAIETVSGKILGYGDFKGHAAGDLQFLTNSRFLLSHQILHTDGATTAENIATGRVIENVIQEIEIIVDDDDVQFVPKVLGEMGEPTHGAADPIGIAITTNGNRLIALSGNDEVLFTNSYGVNLELMPVGNRPVQFLVSSNRDEVFCLNNLSDSISVIDLNHRRVASTISLGPNPLESTRERGEKLFFDAKLSRFGWYSCQSCHVAGHTNGQLADTFSDGTEGAPKRVLSLLGGRDNNPWAWNGSMRSLHDQVLKSGETTMRGRGFTAREANDLVAYLHTLERPPRFRPSENESDRREVERGQNVFASLGCAKCHVPPLTYTSDATYDVGLEDENGQRKFNPPSLNGVGYRRQFFHDGRAETLRDVFIEYGHQLNDAVSDDDLAALIRFLESL